MLFFEFFEPYFTISYNSVTILSIIIFFIVAEKLVSIISAREFREYKTAIFGTLLFSTFLALIYTFDSFLIFIFAYPEILLLLPFVNFIIGRFTGLRVSEYIRFNSVMKANQEE